MMRDRPRIRVRLIGGPDSHMTESEYANRLKSAGFSVELVLVDELVLGKKTAELQAALLPNADAAVVISAFRWDSLCNLVDQKNLSNAIVLTANRSLQVTWKIQPKLVLPRYSDGDANGNLLLAIELITSQSGQHWREFERYARDFMSLHIAAKLHERQLAGIPKRFDMVSDNGQVVGEAKFLTLVRQAVDPPAKFMEIAGHVWLLQKAQCRRRFIIFGNDRRVPERWLKKYSTLASGVEFYFLGDFGELSQLT